MDLVVKKDATLATSYPVGVSYQDGNKKKLVFSVSDEGFCGHVAHLAADVAVVNGAASERAHRRQRSDQGGSGSDRRKVATASAARATGSIAAFFGAAKP